MLELSMAVMTWLRDQKVSLSSYASLTYPLLTTDRKVNLTPMLLTNAQNQLKKPLRSKSDV
jgi:hypothetical protein